MVFGAWAKIAEQLKSSPQNNQNIQQQVEENNEDPVQPRTEEEEKSEKDMEITRIQRHRKLSIKSTGKCYTVKPLPQDLEAFIISEKQLDRFFSRYL